MNEVLPNPIIDQNNARFEARLDITARSEQDFVRYAIHYLRNCGYHVHAPNEKWETVGAFMKRVGIKNHSSFHRDLILWQLRKGSVLTQQTSTGRIRELLSNPAFDAFCKRNTNRERS